MKPHFITVGSRLPLNWSTATYAVDATARTNQPIKNNRKEAQSSRNLLPDPSGRVSCRPALIHDGACGALVPDALPHILSIRHTGVSGKVEGLHAPADGS